MSSPRVDQIQPFLQRHGFTLLPANKLHSLLDWQCALLYDNHHAAALFPFRLGGLIIDSFDSPSCQSGGGGGGGVLYGQADARLRLRGNKQADATTSLGRFAKANLSHRRLRIGDKKLYRLPLKGAPLQNRDSSVCMFIAIGLLLVYKRSARGATQPTRLQTQRLVSYLRRRYRLGDYLVRYAFEKTKAFLH